MKKRHIFLIVLILLAMSMLVACTPSRPAVEESGTDSTDGEQNSAAGEREQITLWFWQAPPQHQVTMNEILVEQYNASQDQYELVIEFQAGNEDKVAVALAANEGPDIVFGSGPSFVAPWASAGKLEPLNKYSEQYGWKDRMLEPIYESATVNGELYSLPNSLNTLGIFYNKALFEENGWEPPQTIEELEQIMDEAMEMGLYASVTGNKGFRPVNENYASLFLTHMAGPQIVYDALTGKQSWSSPEIVSAVEKSAEWYQKGYLAGDDYVNLTFNDAAQLLADKQSPFFIGPTLVFQFASQFFEGEKADDLGFIPFPSIGADLAYPLYTLGVTGTFSINANSEHKDAVAEILNMMMTPEFLLEMTARWPGYWGVPLKEIDVDTSELEGLSSEYINTIADVMKAVNDGRFGYFTTTFFPPATHQEFVNIDTVWLGTKTAEEMLNQVDQVFAEEQAEGMVPSIPEPGP